MAISDGITRVATRANEAAERAGAAREKASAALEEDVSAARAAAKSKATRRARRPRRGVARSRTGGPRCRDRGTSVSRQSARTSAPGGPSTTCTRRSGGPTGPRATRWSRSTWRTGRSSKPSMRRWMRRSLGRRPTRHPQRPRSRQADEADSRERPGELWCRQRKGRTYLAAARPPRDPTLIGSWRLSRDNTVTTDAPSITSRSSSIPDGMCVSAALGRTGR